MDFSQPRGVALVKQLLERCDVLVENFKVGGLAKFGLGYEQLREEFPGLVYCSITGFGQTGPYAHRPGYDMMAQGMGGLISITGEPDRPPSKVPVAINDIMTGMYTAVALLSAVRHRDLTGEGQHVDVGLLDVQVSWLANVASNYLVGGKLPHRLGTAHPNTVPYQVFPTRDGFHHHRGQQRPSIRALLRGGTDPGAAGRRGLRKQRAARTKPGSVDPA